MKLYEYEAREIFSKYSIPVPRGFLVRKLNEAYRVLKEVSFPVVIKAQILVARRAKLGGVRFANDIEDALSIIKEILGRELNGLKVREILVVEKVDVIRELYVGFVIDRTSRGIAFIASRYGGIELEDLAKERPESVIKYGIDVFTGFRDYIARNTAYKLGLKGESIKDFIKIIRSLYKLFIDYECELAEINPLALTPDNRLLALDTKMIVDDNALYRHPELISKGELRTLSRDEVKAKEYGFDYIELEGDIGIIGNGAGLTMATMDLVHLYGGRPADFLDIGGGARADRVKEALKILLKNRRVKVILINILGGITRCDEVASGIIRALEETRISKPLIVRLTGTEEKRGRDILRVHNIQVFDSLEEAAKEAVRSVR